MREVGEIEGAYQAAMAEVEMLGSQGKVEESMTQLTMRLSDLAQDMEDLQVRYPVPCSCGVQARCLLTHPCLALCRTLSHETRRSHTQGWMRWSL